MEEELNVPNIEKTENGDTEEISASESDGAEPMDAY